MLVAQNFNREFLELWLFKHKLIRSRVEQKMSQSKATQHSDSPLSPIAGKPQIPNEGIKPETKSTGQPPDMSVDVIDQESSSSSSSSPSTERPTSGSHRSSSSSVSLEDFCRSFQQAMTIARHAERAKSEARNALDRADTARCLAEQAWEQAMSAAEAAQSIARSGLAVAKLSLDVCNPRSRPNQPSPTLRSAFELYASHREPIMDFDRFQQAINFDDEADDGITPFDYNTDEIENEYPCNTLNCQTCRNRQLAKSWRFFKAQPEPTPHQALQEPPKHRLEESLRSLAKKREQTTGQPKDLLPGDEKIWKGSSNVPKCFDKYSSPLGQFSATSPRASKTANQRPACQPKVTGVTLPSTNQTSERPLHVHIQPIRAQHSASDELEYLTFWPPYDTVAPDEQTLRRHTIEIDDGASSDDSSHSAPVFVGVRSRHSESNEEGLLSPPLKPRQLQRLSDMEPTAEENTRARLQQAASVARRSQSCSSEPGADAARRRPCSPLVLPDLDSGSNVQILPNNVQAFQPPLAKSTTPPTSFHGNVTSSAKAYLSD